MREIDRLRHLMEDTIDKAERFDVMVDYIKALEMEVFMYQERARFDADRYDGLS